ncbi:MAG: polymorphic toxin type 23 domain-containing protein, partial [Bernardetiaceae bacterium]|nr:polymorphic toxin type 23 domain-containing protein [Bernardetiaceae bacterium]
MARQRARAAPGLELDDFGARAYDPQLGRWHAPDPASQFASPYLAMGNRPVEMIDPDGEFVVETIFGAVFGIATQGFFNVANNREFFDGWLQAGITGALSGNPISAVAAVASNQLPSLKVNLGSGFSVSVSPAIAFGGNGFHLGANLGLNYSSEYFSGGLNLGLGYTNMKLGDNTVKGFTSRLGGGFTAGSDDWNAGLYTTRFGGAGIGQRVAGLRLGLAGARITYENDDAPFDKLGKLGGLLKDGGDRWRTNAVSIGYGDFDLRLNMFTGEPTMSNPDDKSAEYPNGYHTGDADMYRLGALSFGYRGQRAGWNDERIRH